MLFLLAGCRQAEKAPAAEPLTKEWKDGSATFRLIVENPDVTLDDDVTLRVEAECPEGVNVELPDIKEDQFDAFVADASKSMEKKLTAQGTMLFSRVYGLEPLEKGEAKSKACAELAAKIELIEEYKGKVSRRDALVKHRNIAILVLAALVIIISIASALGLM